RLEESRWDAEAVWTQLRPALQEALTLFATSRRAEGEALGEDLRRRAATLGELQERVRQHAPLALRHHQQKLRERVSRLLDPAVGRPGPRPSAPLAGPADAGEAGPAAESAAGGVRLDEARLVQELALLADRLDVEEELTRLDHHLGSLSSLLAGEERGPFGRRLDFLVQELMREVNTIGSKGNDALIADLVVSMKSELERIREQVQNLE
ncbi:MAG: DUF1732 domain-containing protein, partial [Deltaproteobacteria bacterium]|nr:DUF1732 domain-containing protein [Deltaproteobacteria bacterium]